ncbi:MAG: TraB/GumN family protein [Rhodospirillales bacterium]|nr:TraB/GumN family protein [Rhodospirillales bacterium]
MQRQARFLPIGFLLPFLALWVFASAATALAGERLYGQGRLWQVTRDGGTPSYVFGTMHSAEASVTALPEEVSRAFDRSDGLVLEVIIDQQTAIQMSRAMLLTDGRSLTQIIGPELGRQVGETAGRYGLPPAQLQLFQPWAVMAMFSLPPAELARQQAGQQPLDRVLQDRATARGTPLLALETLEEQLSVFTELAESDQVALLEASLQLNPRIDEIFEAMKQAYLAGDLDRLHAMSKELQAGSDPALSELFERRLIEMRNHRMIARMGQRLTQGRAFVAVGALHLSGEQGILNLLAQQGYAVERVL